MSGFRERLRRIRKAAAGEAKRLARARSEEARRERDTRERVDRAADEVEGYIEARLRDFQQEFVEFRFDASTHDGRHLRLHWDEPVAGADGTQDKIFHQLHFLVRRYHEYADVEVVAKAIVRNRDRRRWAHEEDVWEGDPERLKPFVERVILGFTELYTAPQEGT